MICSEIHAIPTMTPWYPRGDALTGKLTAHGASATQPAFTFERDLLYVEYKQSPASSYLLGKCTSATDRWTLEMTPIPDPARR